jgi:hypothetical protein
MSPRFLHVANGTCTTRLIEAAGLPGRYSLWADPLHDGPVPSGLNDAELLEVRMRHLAGPAAADPVNDLRQWRAAIERHETYDELVLWFEHDLFDQLNLVQALDWVRARVPEDKTLSLVSIGASACRAAFKGLGALAPAELPGACRGAGQGGGLRNRPLARRRPSAVRQRLALGRGSASGQPTRRLRPTTHTQRPTLRR